MVRRRAPGPPRQPRRAQIPIPPHAEEWWLIEEVSAALLVNEARLRSLIRQLGIPIMEIKVQLWPRKPGAKAEAINISAVRQLATLSRQQLLGPR